MKLHLNPKGFTLFEKDRNLHNIQFDERKGERKKNNNNNKRQKEE